MMLEAVASKDFAMEQATTTVMSWVIPPLRAVAQELLLHFRLTVKSLADLNFD